MKHVARKRFGQNFLKDESVLDSIVSAIAPKAGDAFAEIGPGLGALTEKLLSRLNRLDAVEIDRDLVVHLKKKFPAEKLTIHEADALEFDFASLAPEGGKLRIAGNLPYNISTPILFALMKSAGCVKDQHFMLQKEVVERMTAEPHSKAFGRLSVMLQWRYDMDLLFTVPPEAFTPAPKVDSAIVRMIPKSSFEEVDARALEATVTAAFSQRRKMVRNTLSALFTEDELASAGVKPTERAEDVSTEQYVALAKILSAKEPSA